MKSHLLCNNCYCRTQAFKMPPHATIKNQLLCFVKNDVKKKRFLSILMSVAHDFIKNYAAHYNMCQ